MNRSSALYSIDTDIMGYGFYWWILRQPPFLDHGMYAALGVGNQYDRGPAQVGHGHREPGQHL